MSQMVMVSGGVLVAVVCGVVVRKQAPEIALVLTLCAAVAVLVAVSGELGLIMGYIQRLAQAGGISQELITPVMKTTGIAMLCKFTADFCRDAKENGLASAVELAGTVLGLVAAMPLLQGVLSLLEELLS
ncbi:stage III sporulation protein AD [Pseudoflavonifractor capillosus]|uniref:SpoIIIAC/SpoIIIAD family protein n=1 Tax=Pseudoflavonifractor capillosus TaxID=106588 RepID=UPI00195BC013|nr:SpoIIIAC/SpoIIIAD family protein [Pseudoflavonifractor capillosus]MBM6694008.1 stage III sporulation protein AD [Pseudoflavonifractor capillosus]